MNDGAKVFETGVLLFEFERFLVAVFGPLANVPPMDENDWFLMCPEGCVLDNGDERTTDLGRLCDEGAGDGEPVLENGFVRR